MMFKFNRLLKGETMVKKKGAKLVYISFFLIMRKMVIYMRVGTRRIEF